MSDNYRYRKEFHKPRYFAVDSAQTIEMGDMVFLNTDDIRAASQFTWDTNLATTQRAFAQKFMGVAMTRSASGDTDPIQVNMAGVHEMECASATFELEDWLAPADSGSNTLEDQKVVEVSTPDLAIGKVAERVASAATAVKIDVFGGRESQDAIVNNLAAAAAPTTTNDTTEGYSVGSLWVDTTNDLAYICVDATASAAVWRSLMHKNNLAGTTAPTTTDDASDGYSVGSLWFDTTNDMVYACVDSTTDAAVWRSLMHQKKLDATVGPTTTDDASDGYSVGSLWVDIAGDMAYICVDSTTDAAVWRALMPRHNMAGTAAPTANEDSGDGYSVGSIWCDVTNDRAYICVDATATAAVWRAIPNVSQIFFGTATADADDDTAGYIDVDTGFGAAPTVFYAHILRSGVPVFSDQVITAQAGGAVRVADGGATYAVTSGDVIMVWATK